MELFPCEVRAGSCWWRSPPSFSASALLIGPKKRVRGRRRPASLPAELNSTTQAVGVRTRPTGMQKIRNLFPRHPAGDRLLPQRTERRELIFHKSRIAIPSTWSAAIRHFRSRPHRYSDGEVHITLGEPARANRPRLDHLLRGRSIPIPATPTPTAIDFRVQERPWQIHGRHLRSPHPRTAHEERRGVVETRPACQAAAHRGPSLRYSETTAEIDLMPTGRMTRDDMSSKARSPPFACARAARATNSSANRRQQRARHRCNRPAS